MKPNLIFLLPNLLFSSACVFGSSSSSDSSLAAQDDSPKVDDKYRPKLHFSVPAHWMNDPNGMVYLDGEYHLYFQYYPNDSVWGPMHWGHAVTTDLVNWENLPISLYPDQFGQMWSGSAVADFANSSGFQEGDKTPLVALFTNGNGPQPQQQSEAYSNDNGRTYTKYEGNPVISNPDNPDFRDPKVTLYDDKTWILVLAAGNKAMFYKSENLKNWTLLSEFGNDPPQGAHTGVWECPDLLKMEIDGQVHWVLLISINPGGPNGGSVTQYFVGDFDGTTFTSSQKEPLWLDWGTDNYAGVTFFNEPKKRHVLIAWMNNWDYATVVPTVGWRGQMTLPRILELKMADGEPRVQSTFAPEVEILHKPEERYELTDLEEIQANKVLELTEKISWKNPLLYLDLKMDTADVADRSTIAVCFLNKLKQEVCVGFRKGQKQDIFLDRSLSGLTNFSDKFHPTPSAARQISDPKMRFQIYLDVMAIEVLIDSGLTCMTAIFFPDEPYTMVQIRHHGLEDNGKLVLESALVQGLKPITQI